MPADQLINTKRLRELVPELLTPEGTDALTTLFREILRSFMLAQRGTDDFKDAEYALEILKLAEAELQILAKHLSKAGVEEEGEEIPLGSLGEILAAYRRELATSFAAYLDEISSDLRGMLDPPLPALMTWSQTRQQNGSNFRTRWPRPLVPPATVESASQKVRVVADVAGEVDEIIISLDAQARHLASIAGQLPKPSTAVQALLENDEEAAYREHPLETLRGNLGFLAGEIKSLLEHFRRERSKLPAAAGAEAAAEETS